MNEKIAAKKGKHERENGKENKEKALSSSSASLFPPHSAGSEKARGKN